MAALQVFEGLSLVAGMCAVIAAATTLGMVGMARLEAAVNHPRTRKRLPG